MKKRIVLSARDAGAARGILEVFNFLEKTNQFNITLLAQGVAADIFTHENIPHVEISLPSVTSQSDPTTKQLIDLTKDMLEKLHPEAVLVGLSTPGTGGIDEALLMLANCPTYLLQDFWGDSNLFFEKHPDYYLVADEYAAYHTKKRFKRESIVVGSPRHARYAQLNFLEMRKSERERLGIADEEIIHGFFDQPLGHIPGYIRTITRWAESVAELGENQVVYRPHPASDIPLREKVNEVFNRNGLQVMTLDEGPIEQSIVVSDTASFVMSNTAVDTMYINYFSNQTITTPIYLLFEPDIVREMSSFLVPEDLPPYRQKSAEVVFEKEELSAKLNSGSDKSINNSYWEYSKSLDSPKDSLQKIANLLEE